MLRVRTSVAARSLLRSTPHSHSFHTLATVTHAIRALPSCSHNNMRTCAASSWAATRMLLAPKRNSGRSYPSKKPSTPAVAAPVAVPPATPPAAPVVKKDDDDDDPPEKPLIVEDESAVVFAPEVLANTDRWGWLLAPNSFDQSAPKVAWRKVIFLLTETCTLSFAFISGISANTLFWWGAQQSFADLMSQIDAIDLVMMKGMTFTPFLILAYLGAARVANLMLPSMNVPPCPRVIGVYNARGRAGWGKTIVFSLLSFGVITFGMVALNLSDSPAVELPIVIEVSLDAGSWIPFVAACINAPIMEEILFRGLIFARTVRFIGVIPAIIYSSALFGAIHWSADSNKVTASGMAGIILSALYRATQQLLAPIVVHAANNSFAYLSIRKCSPLVRYTENMLQGK